ncbi:DUF3750 domain-containing protein [Oleiphilus messinensis]|nr:DUF3750 domain-containing protein [Oleiphilus messinensis]
MSQPLVKLSYLSTSNTFPAWIAQQVPELELELPFSAIGSGWAN